MNRHIFIHFCPKKRNAVFCYINYLKDVTTLEANEFCSIFSHEYFLCHPSQQQQRMAN